MVIANQQNDRRRYSRINLRLEGTLTTGSTDLSEAVSVTIIDISLKGALVHVLRKDDMKKFVGGKYILKFKVDPSSSVVMTVACRHVRDTQMGLECLNLDPRSISHVRKIIEFNTGDASIANRELNELMNSHNNF